MGSFFLFFLILCNLSKRKGYLFSFLCIFYKKIFRYSIQKRGSRRLNDCAICAQPQLPAANPCQHGLTLVSPGCSRAFAPGFRDEAGCTKIRIKNIKILVILHNPIIARAGDGSPQPVLQPTHPIWLFFATFCRSLALSQNPETKMPFTIIPFQFSSRPALLIFPQTSKRRKDNVPPTGPRKISYGSSLCWK